jgi:hypothetical protein
MTENFDEEMKWFEGFQQRAIGRAILAYERAVEDEDRANGMIEGMLNPEQDLLDQCGKAAKARKDAHKALAELVLKLPPDTREPENLVKECRESD